VVEKEVVRGFETEELERVPGDVGFGRMEGSWRVVQRMTGSALHTLTGVFGRGILTEEAVHVRWR
jgi:hypothetical protein